MPVITDEFRLANYVEAALWGVIGVVALALAVRQAGPGRSRCIVLAVTMVAFGLSDVVETHTGAWWRPWWLFVWKAVCVTIFVSLLAEYYWRRARSRAAGSL